MSEKFVNPLKEFSDKIIPLSHNFPDNINSMLINFDIKLCKTRIELGKKISWIDWNAYPNHYSFYYDFENNEEVIKTDFRNSRLNKYEYVVMEFGYQNPISKIPVDLFIKYWYELVIMAGYELVAMTEDGELFMEFVRGDYSLKSNFHIRTIK